MNSEVIEEMSNKYEIKGDNNNIQTIAEPSEVKKKIVFGLPGDNFSSKFLLSWTATINALWENKKYDIISLFDGFHIKKPHYPRCYHHLHNLHHPK